MTTKQTLLIQESDKSDDEYITLAKIDKLINPDYPSSPEEHKRQDQTREAQYLFRRVILKDATTNTPLGYGVYGHTFWAHHPDRYFLDVYIKPAEWGQGYGKFLYDSLYADLMSHKPASIETECREDCERSIRFVNERGFKLKTTEYSAKLDLSEFDPEPFDQLISKLTNDGYSFLDLNESQNDIPDFLKRYYEILIEIDKDIPWHESPTPESFEVFTERYKLKLDQRIVESTINAVFDGKIVGLTQLNRSRSDLERVYTGMSGVVKEHRRKGIVTALKALSLGRAKVNLVAQTGVTPAVYTENEASNPMFIINERLGFVRQPSFLFYTKELS